MQAVDADKLIFKFFYSFYLFLSDARNMAEQLFVFIITSDSRVVLSIKLSSMTMIFGI